MIRRRHFIKQTVTLLGGMSFPLPFKSLLDNMKQEKKYDIIIVGGSYAGLAAAMALGRALRKVLVIDSGNPCNQQTPHSHNFLTNDGKTPKEIAGIARQQVQQYKTVDFLNGFVSSGRKTENGFVVETETNETYASKKIVFATGIKDSMPAIPGFAECWGISVLHCPYCHGYEVRHQKTGILANGNDAVELATLISNWTDDLTVYTNGKSTLSEEQVQKLQQHNIHINQNEIEKLEHNKGYVERILFKDGANATVKAIYARLPFVQHSSVPQMLGCELTPEGYIKIDPAQRTNVPGIFACGDNTTRMRTVANAVAMGTTTGMMLNKELIEETF